MGLGGKAVGRRAVVIEPFLAEAETGNEMFSYGGEFSCCFPVLHIERFGPLSARARAKFHGQLRLSTAVTIRDQSGRPD